MIRRWFSIFITGLLFLAWIAPDDAEAARGRGDRKGGRGGGKKQSYYEETLAMPDGSERTSRLEAIIEEDFRNKLGPEPVEILLWIYMDNDELDKVIGMLSALKDRKSTDYELKVSIAESLYKERNDIQGAKKLLEQAIIDVPVARRKVPEGVFPGGWYAESRRIMGSMEHDIAKMLLESGQIDKAKECISRAMSYRDNPEDYYIFSEILLRQGLFRESIGAAMLAVHRGGIKDARETFKSGYDSLQWDLRQYEEYVKSFEKLYLKENVKQVLNEKQLVKAKDIPELAISEILGANGAVLVFWHENMRNADLWALQKLHKVLKDKNIPNIFIYSGYDYSGAMDILRKKNYTFAGTTVANESILKTYKVVYPPTVIVIGENMRLLYRMEGPNKNLAVVFEKVWEEHIGQETQTSSRTEP